MLLGGKDREEMGGGQGQRRSYWGRMGAKGVSSWQCRWRGWGPQDARSGRSSQSWREGLRGLSGSICGDSRLGGRDADSSWEVASGVHQPSALHFPIMEVIFKKAL